MFSVLVVVFHSSWVQLCTTLSAEHKDYAHQLLKFFVRDSAELDGKSFTTYNVHSLIHMTEVVERYGGSPKHCSTYLFENYT